MNLSPAARIAAYRDFLKAKACIAHQDGFEVDEAEISPILKPHQRAMVRWMVRGGRRACFASFGLGKSVVQIEALRLVLERATAGAGRALIIAPLGVRLEFLRDAAMLGVPLRFVRRSDEVDGPGLYLTNYQAVRDGRLDPGLFDAASLDEAACLRGFGGTLTFREFMRLFDADSGAGRIAYRFVATATPSPNDTIELLAYAAFLGILDVGQAKAQPLDAKILTPAGWTTMGDIAVGDFVIAQDGRPTRVMGVYPQGERPVYRVEFSDGSSTECDGDHLWITRTQYERNAERRRLDYAAASGRRNKADESFGTVKTTEAIAATLSTPGRPGMNHTIPMVRPVEFDEREVAVDPWLLGLLLGDACLRNTSIILSSGDEWIIRRAERRLPDGLQLRRTRPDGCDYSITTTCARGGRGPGSNALLTYLRGRELLGKRSWEKRVPADYLFNTVDVRLAVLQGLMDADGTVHRDGTQQRLATSSAGLAEDVRHLVQSLGGTATIRRRSTSHRDAYLVTLSLPAGLNPFALPRKAERVREREKYPPRRYITNVVPVGTKPVQCIAVEHDDHLYVTDDFLVTHNTRFFKRNSEKADTLTLHPHKVEEFWLWVASWGLFVQRPSDLGFSDEGYDLPELKVVYHEVQGDLRAREIERNGQGILLRDAAIGVQNAAREKRETLPARIAKMREVLDAAPDDHFVLWHDLEAERHAIAASVPSAVAVYGSQDDQDQEKAILGFSDGAFQYLAAKPVMLGAGCNLQRHCHKAIFLGIGFKFADFIQAIHRLQRFLQSKPVEIHVIYAETEREILRTLQRKWRQHNDMVAKMGEIIEQFGLSEAAMAKALARSIGCERIEVAGEHHRLVNADCMEETATMEADSVDLIVTSIPFSHQYEYTPSYNDFGHTDDDAHFWAQMDHLTPELLRVLRPGRVAAVHVKDRITPGGINGFGFQTLSPFSDDCIAHFRKHGFAFLGRKTIVTDVVRENNQTYRLGWTEQCKDGSRMGCGVPEYLLLFRRAPTDRSNGYADVPVVKSKKTWDGEAWDNPEGYSRARWQVDAHGFSRSSGDRLLTVEELQGFDAKQIFRAWRKHSLQAVYSFEHHVRIGEGLEARGMLPPTFMLLPPHSWHQDVWSDITRMLTMNTLQAAKGQEGHLCPLQFDIVDRAIAQFSMPGETVFDPFGGLMTVPVRALKARRKAVGIELNPRYFLDGCAYVEAAAREIATPSLFDILDAGEARQQAAE